MKTSPEARRVELGQVHINSFGRPTVLQVEAVSPGYVNGGGTAIALYDDEGPYATLSVNALGTSEVLPQNEFCAKVWTENEHLRAPMLESGLFEDTGRRVSLNEVTAEVWRITAPAWAAAFEAAA